MGFCVPIIRFFSGEHRPGCCRHSRLATFRTRILPSPDDFDAPASWGLRIVARASEGCCFTRTAFGSYLRAIVLNWSRQNGSAMVGIGLAKVAPNTDVSISTITASGFLYSWLGIIMIVSSTISSAPCSRIDATRSSRPAG